MDNSRMEGNGMKEFTQKHQRVLDYIRRCVDDGVPPTVREICDSLGIKSTSTGHKYLRELEEMGYITMGGNRNRCIRLVGRQEEKAVQVPLLGTVAVSYTHLDVYKRQTCTFPSFSGRLYNMNCISCNIIRSLTK